MIVALGYYPGDQELAKKLSSWIRELGVNKGHTALLARDMRCSWDEGIRINLETVFDKVEVITINEQIDGWQYAPNIVIRNIAVHIENTAAQPWLFIEPDVVPLKSGWVQTLAEEYDQHKKPFLGDFVKVKDVIPHCSGVACYPGRVTDHAPDIKFAALSDTPWDVYAAGQIVPRMAQTRHIAHRWLHPAFTNQSEVDNLLGQLGPECVLFHSDHSGTLIDFLRERRQSATAPRPAQTNAVAVNVDTGKGVVEADLFLKVYPKDYDWVRWCFRSMEKFAQAFNRVVVVDPSGGVPLPDSQRYAVFNAPEKGNDGYLSQQVFKLYADTFTEAEFICFMDADTIFTKTVTPETYMKNGKPVWMITPMKEAHPNQQNSWAGVMRKFMGKEPEFEYMRRHPTMVPRWLLSELRAFCLRTHGVELKDYVMAQPYREFSEFNVMGFYAYEYHRDKFEWFDTSKHPENEWPVLTVDQRWSHNPVPKEEWEKILGGAVHSSEPERSTIPTAAPTQPNGLDPMEVIKSRFTSPLAKARIIRSLKAAPILK